MKNSELVDVVISYVNDLNNSDTILMNKILKGLEKMPQVLELKENNQPDIYIDHIKANLDHIVSLKPGTVDFSKLYANLQGVLLYFEKQYEANPKYQADIIFRNNMRKIKETIDLLDEIKKILMFQHLDFNNRYLNIQNLSVFLEDYIKKSQEYVGLVMIFKAISEELLERTKNTKRSELIKTTEKIHIESDEILKSVEEYKNQLNDTKLIIENHIRQESDLTLENEKLRKEINLLKETNTNLSSKNRKIEDYNFEKDISSMNKDERIKYLELDYEKMKNSHNNNLTEIYNYKEEIKELKNENIVLTEKVKKYEVEDRERRASINTKVQLQLEKMKFVDPDINEDPLFKKKRKKSFLNSPLIRSFSTMNLKNKSLIKNQSFCLNPKNIKKL
jgi:hypothetical protein